MRWAHPRHDLLAGMRLRAASFDGRQTLERDPVPFGLHLGRSFAVHFQAKAVEQFRPELTRELPGFRYELVNGHAHARLG